MQHNNVFHVYKNIKKKNSDFGGHFLTTLQYYDSLISQLISFFPVFLQQMSAAVRADFHENSLSSGNQGKQSSNNKLCQDGATSKVISVILGCASKTHSDLEIRSSCLEDVDFPKGA